MRHAPADVTIALNLTPSAKAVPQLDLLRRDRRSGSRSSELTNRAGAARAAVGAAQSGVRSSRRRPSVERPPPSSWREPLPVERARPSEKLRSVTKALPAKLGVNIPVGV